LRNFGKRKKLTTREGKMMKMALEKSRIDEIGKLHGEIIVNLKISLENAIRIGELLTEQKSSLKHGQFTYWIATNLPFSDRTAQNYMRVYRERDRLKTETVSDLKSAYKFLSAPKQKDHSNWVEETLHCFANCVNCAKEEYQCSWKEAFEATLRGIKDDAHWPQLSLNELMTYHVYFFDIVSNNCIPKPMSHIKPTRINIIVAEIIESYRNKPTEQMSH
jgi:hypothetical protein